MNRPKTIEHGFAAVTAGSADYGSNGFDDDGVLTDAGDAIANILHWVESKGADPDEAIRKAQMHFNAERVGGPEELEEEES